MIFIKFLSLLLVSSVSCVNAINSEHCADNRILLHYAGDNLERIPKNYFFQCVNIEYINLARNKIISLSVETFSKNTKLNELNLSRNLIFYLPQELFKNNLLLSKLDLSYNKLVHFNFKDLESTKVHYLNIAHNKIIDFVPNSVCYIPNLR